MKKLRYILPTKKVDMSDVVSPTPSKNAIKVLKNALYKSYGQQQSISKKATSIRSS